MKSLQWLFIISLLLFGSIGTAKESRESRSYLNEIARLSLKKYYPPPGWETCTASVVFTLNADGAVNNIKIRKHPVHSPVGRTLFVADTALAQAITNAAPFPRAPISFKFPSRIVVTFTKNAIGDPITSTAELGVKGKPNHEAPGCPHNCS